MVQGASGTNVIAFKYKDGVIAAMDTGSCYGRIVLNNTERILKLTENCIVLFTGSLGDIQYLKKLVKNEIENEEFESIDPQGIHKMIQRILYAQRSKATPLNVSAIVAGLNKKNNKVFEATDSIGRMLGAVNSKGNFWFDSSVTLNFCSHLVHPIIREKSSEEMSKQEAIQLAEECFRVLCYRDCRATNVIQIGLVSKEGVEIMEPYALKTDWSIGIRESEIILE